MKRQRTTDPGINKPQLKRQRRFKKRTNKLVGKNNGGSTTLIRQLVCPDRVFVKLRYTDTDTPTFTTVGAAPYLNNVYTGNALYRPNGSQGVATGLAQWGTLYNRYRVRAVHIESEIVNHISTPIIALLHVQPDAAPTTFSTWANLRMFQNDRYTETKMITGTNGGPNKEKLSCYVDYPKFFGSTVNYDADVSYSGFTGGADTASKPGRLMEMYLFIMNYNSSNFAASTLIASHNTTITFYAELYDRVDINT